jgi:FlgD Ig-like domain
MTNRATHVLILSVVVSLSGAPIEPPRASAQTMFVNEVVDALNDVGSYTSLALDAQGRPHVSYSDATTADLRYARKSGGVWTSEIADESSLGQYTSLALDAQGNPHVSYYESSFGDLKYARKSGGVWMIETADGSESGEGLWTSLALDAEGNPHVSYEDYLFGDLKYARKSGGVWTIEIADGLGSHTALALDADGNPHVSYRDVLVGNLKYARKSGVTWIIETADPSGNDVGYYTSLALDAEGNPHVSYYDATATDLKYARKSGGVWMIETADGSANVVGSWTSIALDAQGNPLMSYHDFTANDPKYARKSAGVWRIETADGSANGAGAFTSLALDAQGNAHVTYYDATTLDLKYATAAVRLSGPAPGVTWAVGSRQNIVWSGIGPVDVLISADGGTTYQRLETGVTTSPLPIRVSHLPTRFARIRIERAAPLSTAASDSFFTINATITLTKFDATREDDVARLTWETQPGPEADIRYRVERGNEASAFVSIADGLDRGEFVDQSPSTALRYRLIAINGLGEEYVLGETSVAGVLAADRDIIAYPNPASGPIEILYRVPFDRPMGLTIYDLSGRRVRSLIAGRQPLGVQSVTWDRRDENGRDVAAGTYFARLTSGDGFQATERVTVVR